MVNNKDEIEYTEKQWEEEMKTSSFCGRHSPAGSCTIPCPKCGTVGFYGPRGSSSDGRKYRACKFCGFWQEAWGSIYNEHGGKPYRCRHVYCENCHTYNWHLPWTGLGHCNKCGAEEKEINWAPDDQNHPFHKLKEQINRTHKVSPAAPSDNI